LPLSFPAEEKIIIPAHAVAVMAHVLTKIPRNPPSGGDSLIPILVAKRMAKVSLLAREDEIEKVSFDLGSASVMIKLIAGKPPEWLALIPKGEPILQCTIFALQLEAAVKRVKSIVDGKKGDSIVP
jgi:DNA polymerase III sliding clamp (beta) subunit (PCNA family)